MMPSPTTKMFVILQRDEDTWFREQATRYQPGGEGAVESVLNVHDVEATNVPLTVDNDTGTAHVAAAGNDDNVARVKVDKVEDLALLNVELHRVVGLDGRVRVADGAAVVGDDMGDTLRADGDLLNLEELVRGLLRSDAVNGEAALDVVKESEVLARLFNGDDI